AQHRRALPIAPADEIAQWIEPGQGVVDASRRAGDDHALNRVELWKRLAIGNIDGLVAEALPRLIEHGFEHFAVGAECRAQGEGDLAGLDDGEFHGWQICGTTAPLDAFARDKAMPARANNIGYLESLPGRALLSAPGCLTLASPGSWPNSVPPSWPPPLVLSSVARSCSTFSVMDLLIG